MADPVNATVFTEPTSPEGLGGDEVRELLIRERDGTLPPAGLRDLQALRSQGLFPPPIPKPTSVASLYASGAERIREGVDVPVIGNVGLNRALNLPAEVGEQTFGRAATALGLSTPEQQAAITARYRGQAEALARGIAPTTVSGAIIAGGLLATGAAGAALGLNGFWGPALNIAGGAATGAVGASLEGRDPLEGARWGAIQVGIGEALNAVANWVIPRSWGGKERVIEGRASSFGQTLEDLGLPEPLASARNSKELYAAAQKPARKIVGPVKERGTKAIERLIGGARLSIPSVGETPLTLREANEAMSKVGEKAFSRNYADWTVNGVDQRQLYGQISDEISVALGAVPEKGASARRIWETVQQQSARTYAVMKLLQMPGTFRATPKGIQFNPEYLQQLLARPRAQLSMQPRMGGEEAIAALGEGLTGGAGLGSRDILTRGEAGPLSGFREAVSGPTGAGTWFGAVPRAIVPSASAQFAGPTAGQIITPYGRMATDIAITRLRDLLGPAPGP